MLAAITNLLWDYILLYVLVAIGLWFTIASRFVQFRYFGRMFRIFRHAFQHQEGNQISSFQALILSVAGRVGGGNIGGVAVAITLGGPGAVFWMWIIGLMGMATSFFECSLAQLFKVAEADGSFRGGPAFYIERGLKVKWPGYLFSVLLLITFGFGFNAFQSYAVSTSMNEAFGIPTFVTGLALAAVLGFTIFGGVKRIAQVAEFVVPIMAISYILIAIVVILLNITELPAALLLIVESAFGLNEAIAGGIGAAVAMGVRRGLFSNEAGLGSAPNVAAVATVAHPGTQGVVQAFSVFIDTLIICSCTAFMILLSGAYVPGEEAEGVALTQIALAEHVGSWGEYFVSIALLLFAFSSMIYNSFLGENSIEFFKKEAKLAINIFRGAVVVLVAWAAVQDLSTIFSFADATMGVLALVNLIALALLFKIGKRVMDDFSAAIRQNPDHPVFEAAHFQDLDLDPRAWSPETTRQALD